MTRRRKKREETYYYRWLREHRRVTFYLKRDEYDFLLNLASKHNLTIKDFVLKLIQDLREVVEEEYERGLEEGFRDALDLFIENPEKFYEYVRTIYNGDLALFEAPCKICGKPMLLTHANSNWKSEIKPTLVNAFKNWYHVKCKKKIGF